MADSPSLWNVLLIAPKAIFSGHSSNHDQSLFREGYTEGRHVMHNIAVQSFEGLIETLIELGPPMEQLSFSRVCGILNNQEELRAHAGRVCFVRRIDKSLLKELYEVSNGKESQVKIQVMGWDQNQDDFVTVPLNELFEEEESAVQS